MDWNIIPSDEIIQKTADALSANGFGVYVARDGDDARRKVIELLPEKAEVMLMTSVTMDTIGVTKEINESGRYVPVKKKLATMDKATEGKRMREMGGAA